MLCEDIKDKTKIDLHDDYKKGNYFIIYTLVFAIVATAFFAWVLFSGRSLILLGDGSDQHYTALKYYGLYLRNILKTLVKENRLVIPEWDFYIGEGSDIMTVLGYYVIGDPLALVSAFVPMRYTHYLYTFLCILRIYLSGVSFSLLAFGTGKKNLFAVMSGALSYSFCSWTILAGVHPFFVNPMIYFPLIILGIEKMIKIKSPWLFTAMVSIAAASNFYFFYIISVLAMVYTVVRLILLYGRNIRLFFIKILYIGFFALTGVSISGIFLVPVLMALLHDTRMGTGQIFHLLYPLEYYRALPEALVSPSGSYYLYISMTVPAILAVMLLFINKDSSKILRILSIICVIVMIFPMFGRFLNGMSYMTNRWSWAFDLLCAYILLDRWDEILAFSKDIQVRIIILCVCFYSIVTVCNTSETGALITSIFLMVITVILMIVIKADDNVRRKQVILLIVSGVSIIGFGFWHYSPYGNNTADELVANDKVGDLSQDMVYDILGDNNEYIRITGKGLRDNSNVLQRISATQYYWSMSNPYMNDYRKSMEMMESLSHSYTGYDMRSSILALSGVDYCITPISQTADKPYGFSYYDEGAGSREGEDFAVYKNDLALPLGYCYETYVDPEIYEESDPISKQQLQLDTVYLGNYKPLLVEKDRHAADAVKTDGNVVYHNVKITGKKNITELANGGITVDASEGGESIGLEFDGAPDSEIYIRFSGIEYENTDDPLNYARSTFIRFSNSRGTEKLLNYRTPDFPGSSGRDNYIINMGYSEDVLGEVDVAFLQKGKYTIKNVEVYTVPMGALTDKIVRLRNNVLDNITMDVDRVSGTIVLEKPSIMVMSIPYSDGWNAYVDGELTDVFPGNERYLAIELKPGVHLVDFQYQNPYRRLGLIVSLAGFTCLIFGLKRQSFFRDFSAV